jgi:hypothetical protein
LATTELLNTLLFIVLAIERDTDTDTGIVLNAFVVLILRLVFCNSLVSLALDDETSTTCWHETLEDSGKLPRDLLEGTFDSFILALVKNRDKLLDRGLRRIKFCTTLCEGFSLVGKVVVLLKGLFVDVFVLLKSIVDLLEALDNLIELLVYTTIY